MNKAVFLDRDGTINIEKNYLYKVEEFEFLPGVLEGLRRFKNAGYLLIVITNQSGIARGYYTEEMYQKLEKWMCETMKRAGAEVDGVYHCPHLPDAPVLEYRKKCECRKPELGMFEQAIRDFDIDVYSSIAIGDKPRDLAICDNDVTQGFLVYADKKVEKLPHNVCSIDGGIEQVADYILKKNEEK